MITGSGSGHWAPTLHRWYTVAWIVLGLAPTVIGLRDDVGPRKHLSLVLVVAITVGYGVVRLFPDNRLLRPYTYLGLLVVALGAMAGLPGGGAALFIVSLPQFWIFTAGPRAAILLSGAAAGAAVAGGVLQSAELPGGKVSFIVAGYLAAVLLGLGIHRVLEEGEARAGRLSAELAGAERRLVEAHRRQGAADERERLAREIHDTLAQGFASIIVLAEAARADPADSAGQLLSIERTARENFAEARALVTAPREAGPVAATLRRVLDRFAEDTGLTVDADLPDVDCDQPTRIALLRCTQESLANIRRHAGASTVGVVLGRYPGGIELEITDDGRGFAVADSEGFGLHGMRGRVAELGGALTVTSSVGDGTRVHALLPTNGQGVT